MHIPAMMNLCNYNVKAYESFKGLLQRSVELSFYADKTPHVVGISTFHLYTIISFQTAIVKNSLLAPFASFHQLGPRGLA